MVNLTETMPSEERYTFIFQGNSQALDHILVSENIAASAEYDIVRLNAEFAGLVSTCTMLMSPYNRGINHRIFVIGIGRKYLEYSFPYPGF